MRLTILVIGLALMLGCAPEHTSNSDEPAVPTAPRVEAAQRFLPRVTHSREVEALAIEGIAVYRRLIRMYQYTGIYLVGGVDLSGRDDPPASALQLALPANSWDKLTDRDKVALSYFIESQISVVRQHPAVYSLDPDNTPLWPSMEKSFRRICDTCWSVQLGTYSPSKGGVISADRTVLAGDEHGSSTIFGRPEITASELRRNVLKHPTDTLTWMVEGLDPTQKYRIEGEASSVFDVRSGLYIHQTPADRAGAWRD